MISGTNLLTLVTVKWNGKKYPVVVDTDQSAIVFKTQLFSLTGVSPDRQKIMVKGGMLKDDADMKSFKDGQQLMMMGTVGELPKEPVETVKFIEDMSEHQIAKTLKIPAGLANLGNTCYLNSTLQCLRAVPELQLALNKLGTNLNQDPMMNTVTSLRVLLNELENSAAAVHPLMFLQLFRAIAPQFAERNNNGFLQQDAEECWGQIINAIHTKVPGLNADLSLNDAKNFVEQFMTVELTQQTKCDEDPAETPSFSNESLNKLRVNIGSGVSTYLVSELQNSFVEKLEKRSEKLGKNAVYTKVSKISRLPKYLTVNFVRFQWKPQEKIKAKILKRVQFPFDLDMSPFCSEDLQEKLAIAKKRIKETAEAKAEIKKKQKLDDKVETKNIKKPQSEILKELHVDKIFLEDPGLNPSGQYDLVAVLTHTGRAADSGHYIGWVKVGENNDWWKFDDDKVSQCKEEDITKLEGGGDWHSAYICLYRSKDLE